MTRIITTAFSDEINANNLRPALLVKAEFDSGDLNLWTGTKDIVFNGDTYIGAAAIMGIEAIEETQDLEAKGLSFSINGVDSAINSIALNQDYQWRDITMWFAVLDENYELISDPHLAFSGKMDVIEITDSGTISSIAVKAENDLIILKDSKVRNYTHEDQQEAFAGDLGLEFIATNSDVEITWGAGVV